MEIRLTNITKSFGGKQVIAPTTLTIESGSFTTLLGSSGCGKTTLLRMIAGLETPDSGEIWFDDHCVFAKEKKIDTPPEKRGLGFVFQDFLLLDGLTVRQNILLAIGVKVVVLTLGALGIATMWEAVFADVGVTLLAVLNAVRASNRRF